ncbi:MAG: hypothetical protein R3C03_02605 [Pirellulaceae bacterium]
MKHQHATGMNCDAGRDTQQHRRLAPFRSLERRTALISAAVTGKIDVRNFARGERGDRGEMQMSKPLRIPALILALRMADKN